MALAVAQLCLGRQAVWGGGPRGLTTVVQLDQQHRRFSVHPPIPARPEQEERGYLFQDVHIGVSHQPANVNREKGDLRAHWTGH